MALAPQVLHVPTTIRGRVLIDRPALAPTGWLLGFHGYGETADEMIERLRRTRGNEPWLLASVQALHPFYRRRDRAVVASWMTRLDRELAIEDNVEYVERVWHALAGEFGLAQLPCAFLGFSQGVAMTCRAAAKLRQITAMVITGADVPPELRQGEVAWPRTLLARGAVDQAYSAELWQRDADTLRSLGADLEVYEHAAGHDWPDEFADVARAFLVRCLGATA